MSLPGVVLLHKKISISPERTWTETLSIDSVKLCDHPIVIEVQDCDGKVILDYTHHREPSTVEFLEPSEINKSATSENHYQLGLKYENFDNRSEAKGSYINALNIDEKHGLANFQMGLMLLKDADFKTSKDYLVSASNSGIDSAFYYLGLISWYEGNLTEARNYYKKVPNNNTLFDVAQYSLGYIAFRTGDIQKAKDQFSNYLIEDGIVPAVLSGIAFRHDGDEIKAREIFYQVLDIDPLNLVVLNELSNIKDESSTTQLAVFERLVADDPQYILDLACFYLDSGLIQDAISILEEAGKYLHHPMVYYLGAYLHNLQNQKEKAKQCLGQAEEIGPEKVFPSRLWEVIALYDGLNNNPEDFKAMYYLGNFLYAHQRFSEAIDLWEASLEGLDQFDVVLRNLGLAYWQQEGALEQAVELFEKALKINPDNQDIYIHLDDLYFQLDWQDKRLKLLKKMQDLDPIREDLRKRSIAMMVDLGKHDQALDILMTEDFVPLEMDQSFHRVYVKALMLRAGGFLESDQVKEAIKDYKMALQFPMNHGIGQPTTMQNAEVLYRLGCAYELAGDFIEAVKAWKEAAKEHHRIDDELHAYVQMSLDKLGRYSELGFVN